MLSLHDADVSVILDGQLSSTSVRRIDGGMSSLTALLERMLAASQPDASLPQSVLHSLMQACIHVPEDLAYAASQNGELQPPVCALSYWTSMHISCSSPCTSDIWQDPIMLC